MCSGKLWESADSDIYGTSLTIRPLLEAEFCLKGPRTQNNGVLGPKYCNINGIWAGKP